MMKHIEIPASDLRDGDLLRINKSTNYVLVAKTELLNGKIAVTIYTGQVNAVADRPFRCFPAKQTVQLSGIGRNLRP
jgi:hypothetical protein